MAPCSRRRILSWLSSLRLGVFGSSWISPLCFPVCRYAYMATYTALPHVSGWSFVLGNTSWLGFGHYLIFLFAPCGCRRTYCGPHCGSESARVLVSLIGSSPSGVCTCLAFVPQFEAMSESLTHSIPHSFYVESLYASAVGLLTLSGYVLSVPSAFYLRRSRLSIPFALSPLFADGIRLLRAVALAEGHLPMCRVPSEPLGLAVVPPVSPYTGPGQSPQFAVRPLELRSVFHTFLRDVPQVFLAIILSVSLTYACPSLNIPIGLCSLDT